MNIPNFEVFYYWDLCYTKRNLHKVIRENSELYTLYLLNSYNEWEFDDSVGTESLLRRLEDSKVLIEYEED